MSRTVLEAISSYTSKERKRRLERIVVATSNRMTLSKLVDECVEEHLPLLERKYMKGPTRHVPGMN